MNAHQLVVAATLAVPAAVHADGFAYWLWDVTTDDADAIVEPGETAVITLSLLMEADPGDADSTSFCAAILDVLGDAGAAQGHILGWEIHNDLDTLTGDLTTSDGVSLYNINVGQLTLFGTFCYDNPIDVITFQWAPHEYSPFDVAYHTDSMIPDDPHSVFVWEDPYQQHEEFVSYPVAEAAITFAVVPTPPAALALLASPLLARQRRRT